MNARVTTALLCAIFVGCATVETGENVWYKEGATAQERDAALNAAHVQAQQAIAGKPDPGGQTEKQIVITTMTAQGWRLVHKDAVPAVKRDAIPDKPPVRFP